MNVWSRLLGRVKSTKKSALSGPSGRRRPLLSVEALEDRLLPSSGPNIAMPAAESAFVRQDSNQGSPQPSAESLASAGFGQQEPVTLAELEQLLQQPVPQLATAQRLGVTLAELAQLLQQPIDYSRIKARNDDGVTRYFYEPSGVSGYPVIPVAGPQFNAEPVPAQQAVVPLPVNGSSVSLIPVLLAPSSGVTAPPSNPSAVSISPGAPNGQDSQAPPFLIVPALANSGSPSLVVIPVVSPLPNGPIEPPGSPVPSSPSSAPLQVAVAIPVLAAPSPAADVVQGTTAVPASPAPVSPRPAPVSPSLQGTSAAPATAPSLAATGVLQGTSATPAPVSPSLAADVVQGTSAALATAPSLAATGVLQGTSATPAPAAPSLAAAAVVPGTAAAPETAPAAPSLAADVVQGTSAAATAPSLAADAVVQGTATAPASPAPVLPRLAADVVQGTATAPASPAPAAPSVGAAPGLPHGATPAAAIPPGITATAPLLVPRTQGVLPSLPGPLQGELTLAGLENSRAPGPTQPQEHHTPSTPSSGSQDLDTRLFVQATAENDVPTVRELDMASMLGLFIVAGGACLGYLPLRRAAGERLP